jgi:L-arabinonolactonase
VRTASLWIDCRCVLGEGILWSRRRRALVWTDIQSAQVWQAPHPDGEPRTWAQPDRVGCMAECESGAFLLGSTKAISRSVLAEKQEGADLLTEVEPGVPHTRINDGRTDRAGNLVFGTLNEDPGQQKIGSFYQFSARHGLRRLALPSVVIPNSICFSPDGRTMYFCDSVERRIMQCRYEADAASVAEVREFVAFDSHQGFPDGSIVDAEGCLWNAEWRAARVRRYTPAGRVDRDIAVPAKNPTCVVFGGSGLDELFITSARQEMSEGELAANPHAGGVYRALPGLAGLPDALFKDSLYPPSSRKSL